MKTTAAIAALLAVSTPAAAQQSGWSYSLYAGEGDRAAMGCAFDSTPQAHACIVVRCEDDYSIGVHIDTTRRGGDAGSWSISVDDQSFPFDARAIADAPYGARLAGEVGPLVEAIRNGSSLFLDPRDGAPVPRNGIGLSGSLYAINQALYFCAPRTAPELGSTDDSAEEGSDPGSDG